MDVFLSGGPTGQSLPVGGGSGGFMMRGIPAATRMEPIAAKSRFQRSAVLRPQGNDMAVTTQLLTSANGNGGATNGGGGGGAGGGQVSGGGGATLMATGNTHHLFDSAPPIQERTCVSYFFRIHNLI